ncbi:sugar transferase [Tenacibaculum sp. C7A-26P2]|uniref:sugar transferase n=1 Tax=Tenacibaculum sp. C7A-26P2 TaxID=3447504 RepID=UPI003F826B3C
MKTNFYFEEEVFRIIIELICTNPLRTAGFLYQIKNKPNGLKYLTSNFNELPIKSKEKHWLKNKKDWKYRFLSSSLVGEKAVSKNHEVSIGSDEVENTSFELMRSRLLKRIFDIFFSILVCVFVLSWLYPVIFIFIKIESQGPVIFKQHREGLHGRQFICYKFRSMYSNSLTDNRSADSNDKRITKVGAFLRRNSLDELPQFLNVLYGSMSVVGPRPHLKRLAQEYQKEVENYIHRHDVKPGITGLAQVSGYRGKIRKKADIKNRIRLDVFYIKKRSLGLDISIIIKTIYNLLKGDENAC